jgi:hypothetical protein
MCEGKGTERRQAAPRTGREPPGVQWPAGRARKWAVPPDGGENYRNSKNGSRFCFRQPTRGERVRPLKARAFAFFNLVKRVGWPGLEPLWAKPRRSACSQQTGASLRSSPGHPSFNKAKALPQGESRRKADSQSVEHSSVEHATGWKSVVRGLSRAGFGLRRLRFRCVRGLLRRACLKTQLLVG